MFVPVVCLTMGARWSDSSPHNGLSRWPIVSPSVSTCPADNYAELPSLLIHLLNIYISPDEITAASVLGPAM